MYSTSLDLNPLPAFVATCAAQVPDRDHFFAPTMQSVALLAVAVAAPVAFHPGLYAGAFLLAFAGAAFTVWRVRLIEQAQSGSR